MYIDYLCIGELPERLKLNDTAPPNVQPFFGVQMFNTYRFSCVKNKPLLACVSILSMKGNHHIIAIWSRIKGNGVVPQILHVPPIDEITTNIYSVTSSPD